MTIRVPLHPLFNDIHDDLCEKSNIVIQMSETSSTTSDGIKIDLAEYVRVQPEHLSHYYHIDGYFLLEVDENGLYLFEDVGNDDFDVKLPFIDTDLNLQLQVIGVDMI